MNKLEELLELKTILGLLKNDKDKSIRILAQRPELVKYTNKEFLYFDFIRQVSIENTISYKSNILNFLENEFISKKLLLCCLSSKLYVDTIPNILREYSSDKTFISLMLSVEGRVLKYMPDYIKDDFDFLYAIAKKDEENAIKIFEYTSNEIKSNKYYSDQFLLINQSCSKFITHSLIEDKPEAISMLKQNDLDPIIIANHLSSNILKDKDFAYYAVGILPFAMFPKDIQEDKDLITKVIVNNNINLDLIPLDILFNVKTEEVINSVNKINTNKVLLRGGLYSEEEFQEFFINPEEIKYLN